jgi:hypothetical protein
MLKNRECWTRFLSLHGESTCLAPPEGGGNRPSRVLLCRSVAELGGAHSLFRCVPIIRRDRWPPGLVTYIHNSSQHRNRANFCPGLELPDPRRKRHFLQVSLDFVSVVIFAAAFSSYADMTQLRSEHESWRILLRIRPRIRGPKDSLFHSGWGLI